MEQGAAFRRNRTLTGSLVSHVGSATETNSELRSARVRHHDLRAHRRHLGLRLMITLGITAGLAWIIYQSIVVVNLRSDTPVVVKRDTYESVIQDYLNTNPLQRLRATIDVKSMATYMQARGHTEVLTIEGTTERDGFASAGIDIVMRRPVVSWKTGNTTLYVDAEGYAFSRNYYEEPNVTVVDETGIQTVDSRVLASEKFLGMIGQVIGRMGDNGYIVTKVTLPADTTRQLLISVQDVGYPIKFSIDRTAGEQAEDAARSIRHLASKGINPEYLDVRVSGKAFYK